MLAVLLSAVSIAAAQQTQASHYGKTVVNVRVEVERRQVSLTQFQSLVEVRAGQPLRQQDVRASLARLSLLPGFENFEVALFEVPGGVDVVFHLEPRHPIDRVEFKSNTGIPIEELDRLVRQRYGGVPTGVTEENVARTVQTMLADRGYPKAVVTADTIKTHDPDRATLILTIEAGPLSRIGTVRITGSPPMDDEAVLKRAGVREGEPYRRRDVIDALQQIEAELRADGYYEAVTRPIPRFREDGLTVDLTLEIDAGPRVRVEFAGDPPPENHEDLVPIERERSADEDLVRDSQRSLEAALRNEGYRNAKVSVNRTTDDAGVLVITYTVSRGARYRIGRVDIPGGLALPEATIRELLAIKEGDILSAAQVDAGHGRVRQEYVNRGYHAARVSPTYDEPGTTTRNGEPLIVIRPEIVEGPMATVREVRFAFASGPAIPEAELRSVVRLTRGAPYVRAQAAAAAIRLEEFYADRGYRSARVTYQLPATEREIDLTYTIDEGPQIIVTDIVVVGNRIASREAILDEMTLAPGQPFGAAAELESRLSLLRMGVFRNVTLIEQGRLPGESQTTLIVSVEELESVTMSYGGGVEAGRRPRTAADGGLEDYLDISPRGFFEITRRNLGGRNRSISLFSRLALKPQSAPGDPERDGRGFGFSEYRVTGTFTERRAFRTATDLLVSVTSEQAVRTSFNYIRRGANAEMLRRIRQQINIYGRYALDFTELLDERIPPDEQPTIDRLFPQVRLSTVSGGLVWDRRQPNVLSPTHGTFSSVDTEFAIRAIGSEVGYAKVFGQLAMFHPVRLLRQMVVATRLQLGLAHGFERQVTAVDEVGNPRLDPDGNPIIEVFEDLPASQRFFAGGGNTVRGFQLDRLGVPEILNESGLSNGGNGLVVLNVELRNTIGNLFGRELTGIVFVDAGNVFQRAGDIDLGRLRGTWGVGGRYDSPLGPIRLDIGFKMDRMVFKGERESGWEYHLSFGQTF